MSKKQACLKKLTGQPRKGRNKGKAMLAFALILSFSIASFMLAQWKSFRSSFSPLSTSPQASATPQLAKEYIYAGGRLIATEEPTIGGGSSPLSAPSSLTASGMTTPSTQVTLTWTASTGGTVDHYQVERCQNFAPNCYSIVAAQVPATSPTINYSDTTVSAGAAYLYRVRAVDSSGNFSSYSGVDLATAITFTDDPLNPNGTIIKAQHLIQLRQAVNAVRALSGLAQASWTYPDPVSNPPEQRRKIYLEDVTDLRTKLDEALAILAMSQSYPTNPPLVRGGRVSAAHFMQIRERVR